MALPIDHNAPETAPAAATDTIGATNAELVVSDGGVGQADTNGAGIVVAAAGDSLKADLTLLGLEDLLNLRLDEDGPTGRQGTPAGGNANGRQSSVPDGSVALILNDDLPADLTALGLDELLGLDLSGGVLPTLGEIAALGFGEGTPANDESGDPEQTGRNSDDSDVPLSTPHFSHGDVAPVIAEQSLTEQAQSNSVEAAQPAGPGHANGAPFLLDADLPGVRAGQQDKLGTGNYENTGQAPDEPAGGGGGGGGGTNVINGTAGNDVLNGTAGTDLINGMAGNDILDGILGADKLHGGLGDDILVWDAADTQINGGNGTDTLRVDGGDADFTLFGGIINDIEIVDLETDVGANEITLTDQDVLDITDNGDTLIIDGDVLDTLEAGTGWTDGGVAGGYHTYTQGSGSNTATLLVDTDITVNANILL
ncbi:MAG: hypothetical protein GKS02_00560 [Alphaproteobacteria bacterium]|nr:hypothetical protein [Alphaproteobacteria bacterium]